MTDAELVAAYQDYATMHGAASLEGDHRVANKAATSLLRVWRELKRRGMPTLEQMLPLLASPNQDVRLWSAAHALAFAPEIGERVLTEIARGPRGLAQFNAQMTLDLWRRGTLEL